MSEYTPTTDLMREYYVRHDWCGSQSRVQYEAEFDRWLEQHDREVAAKALREAAEWWNPDPDEPLVHAHTVTVILQMHANRIEAGDPPTTTHRAHASADYAAGTNTAKCTCGWEQVWTVFDGSAEMAADYHEREATDD